VPTSSGGTSSTSSSALTLISTTTLSGAGTFDVSGISGGFNDLILVMVARGSDVGVNDDVAVRLNNDSAANYYRQRITANAATITASEGIGQTSMFAGMISAAGASASMFGLWELTIYGYASTSWLKVVEWRSFAPNATSTGGLNLRPGGALWNSTAAVTRVAVAGSNTANLLTGSQLRIYGRL
jgi:hypothetical protein